MTAAQKTRRKLDRIIKKSLWDSVLNSLDEMTTADRVMLGEEIERAFGVEITDDDLPKLQTVEGCMELITEK